MVVCFEFLQRIYFHKKFRVHRFHHQIRLVISSWDGRIDWWRLLLGGGIFK